MRIAIGGLQHETNSFAPSKANFDDFARRYAFFNAGRCLQKVRLSFLLDMTGE